MEYPWGSGVIIPMMPRILGCKFHTTSLTSDAQAGRHVFLFTEYREPVNGETDLANRNRSGCGMWAVGCGKKDMPRSVLCYTKTPGGSPAGSELCH